ncbi:hypothetical protein Tco_1165007 [Tanacetum coccineum]
MYSHYAVNPTDLQGNSDSELSSMPDDDLHSVSEFETVESDEDNAHEVTHSEHNSQDENAFAERLSLCEEVSSLHFRLEDMESSIVQQVSIFQAKIKDTTCLYMYSHYAVNLNSDSELSSMPDDDLHSVSEFETVESDEENAHEVTHSEHNSQDENAFAEHLSIPDHLDHICEEVSSFHSRLGDMESSIIQQFFADVKSSIPALVTSALKEHLPTLIFESLKECLPQIIKEAVQSYIPSVSEQFAAKQTELNKKMVKKMNKQFNIAHTTEIHRFVTLQKELSKVLQSEIDKSVESKVSSGMEEVRDDLQTQTKHLTKYCLSVQDMQSQLQEVQHLLESAIVIDDIAGGRRIRIHMQTLLPLKGVSVSK